MEDRGKTPPVFMSADPEHGGIECPNLHAAGSYPPASCLGVRIYTVSVENDLRNNVHGGIKKLPMSAACTSFFLFWLFGFFSDTQSDQVLDERGTVDASGLGDEGGDVAVLLVKSHVKDFFRFSFRHVSIPLYLYI